MIFYSFLILTFIVIGRPQDFLPFLIPLRPALVLTIMTLAATVLSKKISFEVLTKYGQGRKYALFYLVMIVGVPFAVYTRRAFDATFFAYLTNMIFFYLFVAHVDSFNKLKRTLFAVSGSVLLYAIISLTKGTYDQSNGRLFFGTMYDANDLAYFLVSLFPISIYYIASNEGTIKKVIGLMTVAVSALTILLTGSRGGLLGLLGVSALFMLTKVGNIGKSVKIALLILLLIFISLYGGKINTDRFMTITAVNDYNVSDETGRVSIWLRGMKVLLSNPVTGVGASCFPEAIGTMRARKGLPPRWQAAHNSYLEIVTETGVAGFILFISIVLACLKSFANAAKIESTSMDRQKFKTMTGVLQMAFIGSLITASFLSQGYSVIFTLFFAISTVTERIAREYNIESKKVQLSR